MNIQKEKRMNPDWQWLFHLLNIMLDFLHKLTSELFSPVHLGASLKSNISHAEMGSKIGTKLYIKQISWSLWFKGGKAQRKRQKKCFW